MLKVGFVVTPGFPVMSLAALSVFEFANLVSEQKLYEVQTLSEHGGLVSTLAGIHVDTAPFGNTHFDTLIVGGNSRVVPTSPLLRSFVKDAAKNSRRVASICTGVFTLADAELLHGRRVTTHWLFTEELRSHLPGVRLEEDRIYIVDGSIWTAAGNSAGIDLTLFMLEADHGSELARAVARILVVDYQRPGRQSQHSALLEMHPKSDRIQDVLVYARSNLRASLSVECLARIACLGRRQFSRAFQAEIGMSPAKAVENLRLEAARLMVEQSQHSVDFIATETGFGDEERMRRAFLRVFARPPQVIRRMAQEKLAGA